MLRPCTTSAGWEATGDPLDLAATRRALESAGWQVTLDARVMLLAEKDVGIAVYQKGRVLIKERDEARARACWTDLAPLLAQRS